MCVNSKIFIVVASLGMLFSNANCEDLTYTFCSPIKKQMDRDGRPHPVVWGKPYKVPGLRLKITWRKSKMPLNAVQVIVRYTYRWYECPYPEHLMGVWVNDSDDYECKANEQGVVVVPEYTVEPRGWYKGIYGNGKYPEFVEIEISENITNRHVFVSRKMMDKIKKSKDDRPVILHGQSSYEGEVEIEVVADKT